MGFYSFHSLRRFFSRRTLGQPSQRSRRSSTVLSLEPLEPRTLLAANLFTEPLAYAVGSRARSVAVADFNRDGKLDVATANFTDNSVSVLLANGDGSFRIAMGFAVAKGVTG